MVSEPFGRVGLIIEILWVGAMLAVACYEVSILIFG